MTGIVSLLWSVCICWERETLAEFRLGGERHNKEINNRNTRFDRSACTRSFISHSHRGDAAHAVFVEAGGVVGNEKSGRERRTEGDTKPEILEIASARKYSKCCKENFFPHLSPQLIPPIFLLLPSPYLFSFFKPIKLDEQSDPERQRQHQGRRHRCPAREGPHLRRLHP